MGQRPIGGRARQFGGTCNDHLVQDLDCGGGARGDRDLGVLAGALGIQPGMAYMYAGPGKMTAMAMASGEKNHEAMMKHATKVPNNTVFFMDNGQLYSTSGTLDPTGNFYRP